MSQRGAQRTGEPRFYVPKLWKMEQRSNENLVCDPLGFLAAYGTCQREFHERRELHVVERFRVECRS